MPQIQGFDFEHFSFVTPSILQQFAPSFTLFPSAIKQAKVFLPAPAYKATAGEHSPPATIVISIDEGRD